MKMECKNILAEVEIFVENHPQKNHIHNFALNGDNNKSPSVNPVNIRHPCHGSHLLTLVQDLTIVPPLFLLHPDDELQSILSCSGCNLPISNTVYGCIECRIFFHKFCLEFPIELTRLLHQFHPFHSLFLKCNHETNFNCSACSREHKGFFYVCSKCDFNVGLTCIFSQAARSISSSKGHIIILRKIKWVDFDPSFVCLACGKEFIEPYFFTCIQCKFYFHVWCVLRPAFKSPHHRHMLKLMHTYDLKGEEDELYCDHCEDKMYPFLPIYQCSSNECSFIAHCYCEFTKPTSSDSVTEEEPHLLSYPSLAHNLQYLEMDKSIVIIRDPDRSTMYELTSIYCMELTKMINLFKAADDEKVFAMQKLNDELSTYVGMAFEDFKATYVPGVINRTMKIFTLFEASYTVTVGEYRISEALAPVLKALLEKYGDFGAGSTWSSGVKIFCIHALCGAMKDMCYTEVANLEAELIFTWWDCIKLALFAGFKVQFGLDCLREVLYSFFGMNCENTTMEQLENDIEKFTQEEEEATEFDLSSDLMRSVVTNIRGECLSEEETTLELEEENDPLKLVNKNSWNCFFIDTQQLISTEWTNELTIKLEETRDLLLSKTEETPIWDVKETKKMQMWDYLWIKKKIKTFLSQLHNKKHPNLCCSVNQLDLLEFPFYLCLNCDVLVQSGCSVSCTEERHDFKFDMIFKEPDDMEVLMSQDIYYATQQCCLVCDLPVWGMKTYDCKKHETFFHESCIEIPEKILYTPYPGQTYSLRLKNRDKSKNVTCNVCGRKCRGYSFGCKSFYVEAQCISINGMMFKGSCHDHFLTIVQERSEYEAVDCCSCLETINANLSPNYLYCGICNISFCIRCSLPSTVSCWCHHDHPLKLVDSYVEDDSGEYYCDACEERRNPNHPVYRCHECNNPYVAHISCALSKTSHTAEEANWVVSEVDVMDVPGKEEEDEQEVRNRFQGLLTEDEMKELEVVNHNHHREPHCCLPIDNKLHRILKWYDLSPHVTTSLPQNPNISTLASILNRLFEKYGHFTKGNILMTPKVKTFVMVKICEAVNNMCNVKIKDVSEDDVSSWISALTIAHNAGFQVHPLVRHLEKVISAHFGYIHLDMSADSAISRLEEVIRRKMQHILLLEAVRDKRKKEAEEIDMNLDKGIEEERRRLEELMEKQVLSKLAKECRNNALELKDNFAGHDLL
ncbi:uncharacterized protein LOC124926995 [Impatiens glandulifera]|uniref:uncharacterized protein LOC124926995 n=1 Tax=Impatiens glandulifera TaxID=253017 RepID=UPI001FB0CFC5|nr:uncharacterized protein LOC124926995 [Impatiens glandulifera]